MRRIAILLTLLIGLTIAPATVAATETRAGGGVVVESDERVDGLVVTAGSVVVRGTVDGDLRAYAGRVQIAPGGEVTGDVEAAAGAILVRGTVGGDLRAAGGGVRIATDGAVGESVQIGSGRATIDGTVERNLAIAAGTIAVGPTASIGGDLSYDGFLSVAEGATISGQTIETEALSAEAGPLAAVPWWAVDGYWFVANLFAAGALLLFWPRGSETVVDRIRDPVRTGGIGLLTIVVTGALTLLLGLSAIGLPIAVLGLVGLTVSLWAGSLYARYAVGAWLLDRAEVAVETRASPLLVGVIVTGIAGAVPVVGPVVRGLLALVGCGAVITVIGSAYRDAEWSTQTTDDPHRL